MTEHTFHVEAFHPPKLTGTKPKTSQELFPSFVVCSSTRTSLVAQTVKRLPSMRETQDQSLGWEDLLEKETATHASTLAWKIPWMEETGRLQSMRSQRVRKE